MRLGSSKPLRASSPFIRVLALALRGIRRWEEFPYPGFPFGASAPRGNRPSELSRTSVTPEMAKKSATCRTCSRACGAGGATPQNVVVGELTL